MAHEVNQNPGARAGDHGRFDPRLFLRDEELDRGIALVLAGERALMAAADCLQQSSGLNASGARALLTIRFEQGLTVSDLRDRLGASVPTLARILGDLDQRGLIERERAASDARRRKLSLSEAGEQASAEAVSAMRAAMREAFREAGASAVAGTQRVLEALKP